MATEKLTAEEQFDALKKALTQLSTTVTGFVENFTKLATDAAKKVGDSTGDFSKDLAGMLEQAAGEIKGFDIKKVTDLGRANLEKFNNDFLSAYTDALGTGGLSPAKVKKAIEDTLKKLDIQKEFGLTKDEYKEFVSGLQMLVEKNEKMILKFKNVVADLAHDIMLPFDKLIKWVERLPGGNILSSALGVDDLKKDIETKIKKELAESYDSGVRGFALVGKAGTSAFKNIANAIKANPMLLMLGAASLILYGLIKLGRRYLDVMKGIRDQTGLVGKDAADLASTSKDIAATWSYAGLTMEAVAKGAAAIVNEFQYLGAATDEMVEGVGMMVGLLGVTEQSAAKVARLFKVMDEASGATVKQMGAAIQNAAKLGGVAPAKVFDDMAQSTKEIQTYFKGSFTAAAKAAIELRRMGTSLKDAAASAKSMVDFESSIGSELEASVLLGRQLDFGAARYYAFIGDIENQQKAVLKQVGSLAEFNAMMPFQKEAIAKAAGMEVDQLGNMLQQQKLLAGMDAKQKKDYKDSLSLLENMRDVDADKLISENKSLIATEQLKNAWDNILMALSPVLDWFYKIAEGLAAIVEWMGAFGGVAVIAAGIIGGILLKAVTSLIGALGTKISGGLMDMMTKPSVIGKAGEQLELFGSNAEKFSKGAGGGWGLAKAAVGLILIAGALWIFAQALKVLDENTDLVGTLAAAAAGLLILAGIAILLASFAPVVGFGALAMIGLAVAVGILGYALQLFIPVIEAISKAWITFITGILMLKDVSFTQLAGIAGGIALIGLSLAAFGATGIFGMFGLLQLLGTTAALKELSLLANPLNIVATSIERLGTALKVLESASVDVGKLEDIADLSIQAKTNESPLVNVAAPDNSSIVKKLDEMINRIESLEIKIDGKKIGEVISGVTTNPGFA